MVRNPPENVAEARESDLDAQALIPPMDPEKGEGPAEDGTDEKPPMEPESASLDPEVGVLAEGLSDSSDSTGATNTAEAADAMHVAKVERVDHIDRPTEKGAGSKIEENKAAPVKSVPYGKGEVGDHDRDDGEGEPHLRDEFNPDLLGSNRETSDVLEDTSLAPPGPDSIDRRRPLLLTIVRPSMGTHSTNDESLIVDSLHAESVPYIPVFTAQNVTLVDERGDRDRYKKLRIRMTVTTAVAVVAVVAASAFVVYWIVNSIPSQHKCVPGGDNLLGQKDRIAFEYDLVEGASFGYDMASFENSMVVGKPIFSQGSSSSAYLDPSTSGASAYVFSFSPNGIWTRETELLVEDDGKYHPFQAHSVAMYGDTIVVGDYTDKVFSGAAYIFTRDDLGSWLGPQKLVHPNQQVGVYRFGFSVGIFNDTIVVGSAGTVFTAFFYMRNNAGTWKLVQKENTDDGKLIGWFGFSVDIYADVTVVSSVLSGSAYVFSRDRNGVWMLTDKLVAEGAIIQEYFGVKVAIFDDTIIVGSMGNSKDTGHNPGAVYVYSKNVDSLHSGWLQKQKLVAGDMQNDAYFGFSIQVTQHNIVVGAPGDYPPNGIYKGGVYVYSRYPDGAW
eukprot:CAMPEP_0194272380 /NCGR_PEP_ID=MMETSP0169-20130528/5967_1 /TAXON_ID=218684 /ORGANISM="Corethron pennatum, Strain L29A3" /LENGTH=611 /DNA_ID=CAMNT_0039015027 /DNA_START=35 /DNA_END=1867 /DNA_ORIENTATION=+